MPITFEVAAGASPETRVLRVSGDVDMDSSPQLKEQILKAAKGARTLKLHLRGVNYLDSSGIAVLIQGLKECQRARVEYILQEPSPQVMAVIQLAMLQSLFQIEPGGTP
jgi:anti-sigma B factor antagonist